MISFQVFHMEFYGSTGTGIVELMMYVLRLVGHLSIYRYHILRVRPGYRSTVPAGESGPGFQTPRLSSHRTRTPGVRRRVRVTCRSLTRRPGTAGPNFTQHIKLKLNLNSESGGRGRGFKLNVTVRVRLGGRVVTVNLNFIELPASGPTSTRLTAASVVVGAAACPGRADDSERDTAAAADGPPTRRTLYF
jgi:hypothetical protein